METPSESSFKQRRNRHPGATTKTVAAIRHVHFEDLGVLAGVFRQNGYEIVIYEAGLDDLRALEVNDPELLVVLGGPISANGDHLHPFLADERRLIEKRLSANRPTLGICLGAQLIARVAGGRVYPATEKEIGWAPLVLTEEGKASPLRHLNGPVLHWHGDTFDLPLYATRLASTTICANQAFALGQNVLALQFHAELDGDLIERWLIGHACELASAGVDVPHLRQQTVRFGAALREAGARLAAEWLAGIDVR